MKQRYSRRAIVAALLGAPLVLAACLEEATEQLGQAPTATLEPPSATASPTLTPEPTATPTPPPQALELQPAQIVQGRSAVVVLNRPASAATLTFQGRQYPMLRSGDISWAPVGTGAFTRPGSYPVSVSYTPAGQGGATSVSDSLAVAAGDYRGTSIYLDAQTSALLAADIIQAELNHRAEIYSRYRMERRWSGVFLRPCNAPIGDSYGEARSYNGAPPTDYHRGTDFTGGAGEPVFAAATGEVAFVGPLKVRGNSVIIDHGAGIFTAYHHLFRIDVEADATVIAGRQVGLVGATGLVTGPHLHWEVLVRGIEVDGEEWLTRNFSI
jgi:murein DD-endopeptidase MepM/ murein hydrolase activator NlpD